MGSLQATEMVGLLGGNDTALAWHLSSNHFPPVHSAFIPICREAIERANGGDWDHELTYPNGLVRSVAHTVKGLHLDSFLAQDDDWDDEYQ